jgi:hypothetical protein
VFHLTYSPDFTDQEFREFWTSLHDLLGAPAQGRWEASSMFGHNFITLWPEYTEQAVILMLVHPEYLTPNTTLYRELRSLLF